MSELAAPIADSAPLSVDQAAGLLGAREPEEVITDAPAEAVEPPSEAEPPAEDAPDPELVIEDEPEEQADPEPPVIAPPQSWDAAERAVFATLSPEAQRVIAARDAETNKAVSRAQTERSEAIKKAEAEVQSVTQLRAATEQVLTRAAETFKGKWDNVDWQAWAQQDPAAYVAGKAAFEAEQTELARIASVHQAQAQAEQRAFQTKKIEDLKTLAPDLLDPVKGKEKVAALESYIIKETGIDPSVLSTLDAKVIVIAKKAMLYDAALARKPTPPPAPKTAAIRPAAASTVRTPEREAQAAFNRLAQTGSVEDTVALLNLRSK